MSEVRPIGLPFFFVAVPLLAAGYINQSPGLTTAGALAGSLHLILCNAYYIRLARVWGVPLRGVALTPPLLAVPALAVLAAAAAVGAQLAAVALAVLAVVSGASHAIRIWVISGRRKRLARCMKAIEEQLPQLR